ncbi:long-chain-fatty-acid--CoA ligase [Pseudomonas sp. 25 R 14]|uniref:long-chain-fatty-acid--CoA ligase n=1 Tax=Pseudomonas sp. 25 R 14 TaxID=1844109 RepID=UPI00081227FE|nr:long-chain-fatty-acid--CoA ligase [Pseudomonas sp. 25 R 14]CRM75448.1 Long-chain-fatty-acid--CoA ligase FadD13 [Pseudomonas sp. 25 R 14]
MYLFQPVKRSAQIFPNKIATINGARQHTWVEFQQRVARMAGALKALGGQPGDRAAILALNSDRYLELFFSIPWAGYALVPLNTRWSIKENVYSLEDCAATVLFVDEAFKETAGEILRQVECIKTVIYMGEGEAPDGMLSYEALILASEPVEPFEAGYSTAAGIFYTGGTTGFPKGVMLSHQNLCSSSLSILTGLSVNDPGTVYLHAAPMFHLADLAFSLTNTIAGSTHTFVPEFDVGRVLEAIVACKVTDILLVPTMISMLLDHPALASADISSLRKIVYGASPMPEGTLLRAMDSFAQVDFYQAYGQTELGPLATILGPRYHVVDGPDAGRLRSAGQAGSCVELKIVGSDGVALIPGEIGEVAVRGPNTMLGYWNNPEQTKATLVDGWVMTGDAGYLDDEGFLFLVDRVKDMIISGGENVFSAEVESAISKHPAIHEVVVIGIPSVQWGESVHAIIRLRTAVGVTEQEIIDHCRQYIAGYKCPRSVVFREEPFPLTAAGKLRKVELRETYWRDHSRGIN